MAVEEKPNLKQNASGDDLKDRIFRLRLPKRSATNIIQKWVAEGNTVTASELRNISKELRKSQRYKHALEVRLVYVLRLSIAICVISNYA